jgi:RNA-directed DNA polymerase
MRAEQRHRPVLLKLVANSKEEEPVAEAKPYEVPKRLVWEAYKRVKANRGASDVADNGGRAMGIGAVGRR